MNRDVGPRVDPLPPGLAPGGAPLLGQSVNLVPVNASEHGTELYASFAESDPEHAVWTWMPYGPFADRAAFQTWLVEKQASRDPWFYAIIDHVKGPQGMAAFMRLDAKSGVIEIGNIWFAPSLQKTRAATEAIYLLMAHAFEVLQVRRLEWKCDALNTPSRAAAQRFGFQFEGLFRQHMIIKGRNRDTAWFAMTDGDWPIVKAGFEKWLAKENFDISGQQKAKLQVA